MAKINTVKGQIGSAELGVTLMHEHLNFRTWPGRVPEKYRRKNFDYQVKLLQDAVKVGVNTIVDCGPFPDVEQIIELSGRIANLNVILSTGTYLEGGTPASIRDLPEDGLVEHMAGNITRGFAGFEDTGI